MRTGYMLSAPCLPEKKVQAISVLVITGMDVQLEESRSLAEIRLVGIRAKQQRILRVPSAAGLGTCHTISFVSSPQDRPGSGNQLLTPSESYAYELLL